MAYNWERGPTAFERHWKKAAAAILILVAGWLLSMLVFA
jgi:hypothetical protein